MGTAELQQIKEMKLKAELTIATGQFENIRPQIEIEVPDGLKNEALVKYLHSTYHGLLTPERMSEGRKKSEDVARDSAERDVETEIKDDPEIIKEA